MPDPAERFVLDSNIISRILRRDVRVTSRLIDTAKTNARVYLCPVVYYEVRRGLLERGARRQLGEFDALASTLIWEDFEHPMWEGAATTWADCRRRGRPRDDADLLIAEYARHLQATLVTSNTGDFEDLGVRLANWVV
jgi:predicted nucleic acid-binding protein